MWGAKNIYLISFLILSFLKANTQNFDQNNDALYNTLTENLKKAKVTSSSKLIAQSNFEFGNYYFSSGLFTQAIAYYNNALIHANSLKKQRFYVALHNKLGQAYLAMNNYNSAKTFFEEAWKNAEIMNDLQGVATSKSFLGHYHEKQGEYLEALKYQQESLQLFEQLKDHIGVATVNENIGSIYEDLIQYDKAYTYFIKAYVFFKGTNSKSEVNVLNNIGDIYRKKEDYTKAILFTQKAIDLSLELKDSHLIESAYKDLSKIYALTNDFEKAYANRVLSEEYGQKALVDQNQGQLSVLQAEYDSKKKEAQIQLLLEQNKVSRANQRILMILFLFILFLVGVFMFYYYKKRRANLKIQEYKQRMLKAQLDKKAIEEKDLQKAVQLKTAALSKYSLHVAQKNKILEQVSKDLKNIAARKDIDQRTTIKSLAKDIDFNLNQENEWTEFNSIFSEVHPDFIRKLSTVSNENLTPSELKLGMLLRLNMSSKEIASILRVTPDSVRVARYRLRKKLPINSKKELVNFMLDL